MKECKHLRKHYFPLICVICLDCKEVIERDEGVSNKDIEIVKRELDSILLISYVV